MRELAHEALGGIRRPEGHRALSYELYRPVIGTVEYIRPEARVPVLLSVALGCGRTALLAVLPEGVDPVPHGEEGGSLGAGL